MEHRQFSVQSLLRRHRGKSGISAAALTGAPVREGRPYLSSSSSQKTLETLQMKRCTCAVLCWLWVGGLGRGDPAGSPCKEQPVSLSLSPSLSCLSFSVPPPSAPLALPSQLSLSASLCLSLALDLWLRPRPPLWLGPRLSLPAAGSGASAPEPAV